MKHPKILCIGAPKAGTTWMFDNLKEHPDIWTLPYKSTQYLAGRANLVRRLKWKRRWKEILNKVNSNNFLWHLDHFFYPVINDRWYERQFLPAGEKVSIDISPSYSTLNDEQVKRVKSLHPQIKVIFLLRNPIERMWSHSKLELLKNKKRNFDEVSSDEFLQFFDSETQMKRTDYLEIIHRWRPIIGQDNFLILFYDEIGEAPFSLLEKICAFMRVEYRKEYFEKTAQRNIFKGLEIDMPEEYRSVLTGKYHQLISDIRNEFGGYANSW